MLITFDINVIWHFPKGKLLGKTQQTQSVEIPKIIPFFDLIICINLCISICEMSNIWLKIGASVSSFTIFDLL